MLVDNALESQETLCGYAKNVPSSAYIYFSHVRSLPEMCVISLSNWEIWLQIKPNIGVTLTLDAGESESMLEIRRDSLH